MKNIKAIIAIITVAATAVTVTTAFAACSKKAPEKEMSTQQTTVSTAQPTADEREADTTETAPEKSTESTQKKETTAKKQSAAEKQAAAKPAQAAKPQTTKPQTTKPAQTTKAPETTRREETTIPLKTTAKDIQKWGNDFIKGEHHIKVNSSLTPQNSTVGLGIAIYDYQLKSGDTQLNVMHGIGFSISMAQEEHGRNCIEDMFVYYDEADQYFHILYRLKSDVNANYDVGFVH